MTMTDPGVVSYVAHLLLPFDLSAGDKVQPPVGTAPPAPVMESLPMVTDSQPPKCNYVDCTESNDDEEEEEENGRQGDTVLESDRSRGSQTNELDVNASSHAPKWEDFFTTETLPDSQNSLTSRSCSVPSPSLSRVTGSQTPELFSEEEGSPVNDADFSLTLSLSNHSSQNQESEVADTLILPHENAASEPGSSGSSPFQRVNKDNKVQAELEPQSESQASSDFDIPSTPESKKPRVDELLLLYRKLAAGDEPLLRKSASRGSDEDKVDVQVETNG